MTTARPLDWPEPLTGRYLTYSDHDPGWVGGEGTLADAQLALLGAVFCVTSCGTPVTGQGNPAGRDEGVLP